MFLLLLLLHRLMLINSPPPPKKKKILNPLLACVVWGTRNCESSLVFLGIRNSESTRVLFGRSAILDALLFFCKGWHLLMNCRLCSLRIKKLESLPVFYGEPSSRDKKFRQSFSCLNLKERIGDCLEEFDDSLQTGRRFLWVLTSA